jgi:hypothetical protein
MRAVLLLVFVAIAFTASWPESSKEIMDFWTKEKMQGAVPMDLIITNDKEALPITKNITQGTRPVPAEHYGRHPYSRAGRLFFEVSAGRTASCSASSLGKNILLTAGHCVSTGARVYYSKWMFCPQYYNGECVKGRFPGVKVWTTNEWHQRRQLGRDVAFIKVDKSSEGKEVEEVAGKYNMRYNGQRNLNCIALGYPGNHNNGRTMTKSVGKQSPGHSNYQPQTVKL